MQLKYPGGVWRPSPNFSRGWSAGRPTFLVVHVTDGQPLVERAVERLCDPKTQASAHFVVGQCGEVYQAVSLADRAWHAKGWNAEAIGIEHVARTPGELDRQWLTLSQEKRRTLLPDGVPLDLDSASDPGFPPTVRQICASSRLAAWLYDLYGWSVDRDTLRGHYECPGTTHADCGRGTDDGGIWPWDRYLEAVGGALAELRRLGAAQNTAPSR